MMKKYRFGIVGTGVICNYFCGALKKMENAEIYAVCSRTRERGEEFSRKYGGKVKVFTDLEEMCRDDDLDVVYVGVPHTAHLDAAYTAISNSIPVICEKPMSVNLGSARQLIELAREKRVFLMEALWTAFLPAYLKAKEWAVQGRIGRINRIYSDYHFCGDGCPADHRLMNPALGGGSLLDIGVYNIFFSNDLLGSEPRIVSSDMVMTETGVDYITRATLDYDGVSAEFSCGFDRSACIGVITGDEGTVVLPAFNSAHTAILIKNDEIREYFSEPYDFGLEYEARHVIDCLEKGLTQSPVYPLSMTERELAVCDRLRAVGGVRYPQDD